MKFDEIAKICSGFSGEHEIALVTIRFSDGVVATFEPSVEGVEVYNETPDSV